ncbi:MAG: hypothetical protein P4K83_06645 [Terracidiphilus sp.]|nr:hypothetical protein [Terracidiphilus sp.]
MANQVRESAYQLLVRLFARTPLNFRVLCRQFMLRVVDLEALSIQADVAGYMGQFARVAIMFSFLHCLIAWAYSAPMQMAAHIGFAFHFEQYLVATQMLMVGLFTVISWDAIFPDRRDILILSPLPIRPHTILFAKVCASLAILGMAMLALNFTVGFVWSFFLSLPMGFVNGFLRTLAAYWITMALASIFLYCAVLTLQGTMALVLPRRLFLRTSALLQLAAFGAFLGTYFMQGTVTSLEELNSAASHTLLASSPSFWFFGIFNQLRGVLPPELDWLALRAWTGLAIMVPSAAIALLLCYVRTMRKTVEEPDLVPAARGRHWELRIGSRLQTAITLFSWRTLTRSRQHRVILAFYLSIAFAIALAAIRGALIAGATRPFTDVYPAITCTMMVFTVMGFRNVFSLPISLTANWVLQTTQLRTPEHYIAAARRTLLLFAVLPVWCIAALLGLTYRPLPMVAGHLFLLAILGVLLADASLIGFAKVPFTCSLLPGNSNFQFTFWKTLGGLMIMCILLVPAEMRALHQTQQYAELAAGMMAVSAGLWAFNRWRARSAVLYFEEEPEEIILKLGL